MGAWRDAFIGVGNGVETSLGVVADTFETAITWDRWPEFDATVRQRVGEVLADTFGDHHSLSCRFTHVYTDGPAPYYTWSGMGRQGSEIAMWQAVKDAANEVVASHRQRVSQRREVADEEVGRDGGRQREMAFRFGVNLVMYVLTGSYKSDQVHVPALLERLGN